MKGCGQGTRVVVGTGGVPWRGKDCKAVIESGPGEGTGKETHQSSSKNSDDGERGAQVGGSLGTHGVGGARVGGEGAKVQGKRKRFGVGGKMERKRPKVARHGPKGGNYAFEVPGSSHSG